MLFTDGGIETDSRLKQDSKIFGESLWRLPLIDASFKDKQSAKADKPMPVTLAGTVTVTRLLAEKANSPMFVTLVGITILVTKALRNAEAPMVITPSGI